MANSMSGSDSMMAPKIIDFSVLATPGLDYFSIKRAKLFGLSDGEIASVYLLGRYAHQPMQYVLDRIENGDTFESLSDRWLVSLDYIRPTDRRTDMIREYVAAYECTGRGALRGHHMMRMRASETEESSEGSPLTATPMSDN
jgi:hypothetical protein